MRPTRWKVPALIFLVVSALLLLFHGNRLIFTNDEGIILEPAQRMLGGARPYVDFFGYMSPGSYWLQSFVFRWLGVSLRTGRLLVILDFSAQCALIYWLVARLASAGAAVAVLLTFAGFQIADPTFLTAQHRWDSATLALAGLCLAVHLVTRQAHPYWWAASGALLAAAAWCTPSMVLVVAAEALWLLAAPERRRAVFPFAGGVLAVTAAAVGTLVMDDALPAFFRQLMWLRQNYETTNVMPYGSVNGGYGNLLADAAGPVELALRILLVGCFALPAILPPVAVVLWSVALWRGKVSAEERPTVQLLLLGLVCLVATAFPRADVMHLAFVAALPYALVAGSLARYLPARASVTLAFVSLMIAGIFAANNWHDWRVARPLSTPVGTLRVAPAVRPDLERLLSEVRPSDTLFVYPYMPMHYFLTQAKNPTRFYYLQPGMMTGQEERQALQELQARPPQWLLYLRLSHEEFMRLFPFAPNAAWRFETLEGWLQENYQAAEDPVLTVGGYQLWRRKTELAANERE